MTQLLTLYLTAKHAWKLHTYAVQVMCLPCAPCSLTVHTQQASYTHFQNQIIAELESLIRTLVSVGPVIDMRLRPRGGAWWCSATPPGPTPLPVPARSGTEDVRPCRELSSWPANRQCTPMTLKLCACKTGGLMFSMQQSRALSLILLPPPACHLFSNHSCPNTH